MINLDKKEYIAVFPLKFWEHMANHQGKALIWLLTKPHKNMGLGWGDLRGDYKYLGRWAGDRIIILGDYDETFTKLMGKGDLKDITCDVLAEVIDYMLNNHLENIAKFFVDIADLDCAKSEKANKIKELKEKLGIQKQ